MSVKPISSLCLFCCVCIFALVTSCSETTNLPDKQSESNTEQSSSNGNTSDLAISPTQTDLIGYYMKEFSITGGTPPYQIVSDNGGTIVPIKQWGGGVLKLKGSVFQFHAPDESKGSVSLTVTDENGDEVTAIVTLLPEKDFGSDEKVVLKKVTPNYTAYSDLYELDVDCAGYHEPGMIPTRPVNVEASWSLNPTRSMFFSTGGSGAEPFAKPSTPYHSSILQAVISDGVDAFQIYYPNGFGGLPAASVKAGFAGAMCIYAATVRWVLNNIARNKTNVCAQGTSGGAYQIMTGMEIYGLADVFDMIIPTSGPTGDIVTGCSLQQSENPLGYGNEGGVANGTDFLNGWYNNGDYCINKDVTDPEVIARMKAESFINEFRRYTYPKTDVYFLVASNETSTAPWHAALVRDQIQTFVEWNDVMNGIHGTANTPEGEEYILDLVLSSNKDLCR